MNRLLYILFLFTVSCTATRKTTSTSVEVKHDSLVSQSHDSNTSQSGSEKVITIRDTLIGVSAKSVQDHVKSEDQQLTNKTGKKIPVHQSKTENGLTTWINIDTLGNIEYGARSDSFNILVRSLTRERDSSYNLTAAYKRQLDFMNSTFNHETVKETVREVRTFWGWVLNNVPWLLPLIVVIVLAIRFFFPGVLKIFRRR